MINIHVDPVYDIGACRSSEGAVYRKPLPLSMSILVGTAVVAYPLVKADSIRKKEKKIDKIEVFMAVHFNLKLYITQANKNSLSRLDALFNQMPIADSGTSVLGLWRGLLRLEP